MVKACGYLCVALAATLALAGCGGVGQSLTGGSVPIGGRVITGVALLPDGAPVANSTVTVRSVPAGAVLQTGATDATGKFTVGGVPADSDVSVSVSQPPSTNLELIVPGGVMGSGSGTSDVGTVNALTTVVAACIHLEHGPAPEDAHTIVSNQRQHLNDQVDRGGHSIAEQRQWISDPASLNAQALTLIVPAANTELARFAAAPGADTAVTALNGLLGYVRAAHRREIHLSATLRSGLVTEQLAGKTYPADTVAAALVAAGARGATASQVASASARERTELTALPAVDQAVSPFEALVIAADVDVHGGFQLDQRPLENFLTELLKH